MNERERQRIWCAPIREAECDPWIDKDDRDETFREFMARQEDLLLRAAAEYAVAREEAR